MSETPSDTQVQPSDTQVQPSDTQVHLRKTRVGVVISNKMDKTLVVEHVARVPHPKFNKIVKRSKKYYVHDENNQGQIGDRVRIVETRPLSKLKCWTLAEVISH